MAYENKGSRITGKGLLKNITAEDIEVVGGLVEYQEVGGLDEDPSKGQPARLSPERTETGFITSSPVKRYLPR